MNLFLLGQGHRFIFIATRDKGLGGGKRYALRPHIIIIIIIIIYYLISTRDKSGICSSGTYDVLALYGTIRI